jgi:hypothetical protein
MLDAVYSTNGIIRQNKSGQFRIEFQTMNGSDAIALEVKTFEVGEQM